MYFVHLICHTRSLITGFAYPTYATYKLIESKADSTAVKGCLTYWTVFGLLTLLEGPVDLFLSWVPLYSIARVGFQAWLFTHNFAGAIVVYQVAVVPVLSKMDILLDEVSKEFSVKAAPKTSTK
jgi:receptor expression-enhancing protein 5/6